MKFIAVFLIALFSISMQGQDLLLKKEGRKYYYNGSKYKCKDLSKVYVEYTPALKKYKSAKRNRKAGIIMGVVGIPFIVGGVLVSGSSSDFGTGLVGAMIIAGGALFEVFGVVLFIRSKLKFKKAMNMFNFEMMERHGYKTDSSFSFGMAGNGVGFVYHF